MRENPAGGLHAAWVESGGQVELSAGTIDYTDAGAARRWAARRSWWQGPGS
ncbi:MAG TPA: hypothetical protein VKV80_02465 [Streptosporangiaceae bacterium]|nr:hypothetical protein [Streptosporangiaceae bacterium]